jgi:predicted RNA binding protein YcfA (HicA-like mRNA interferase family)
VGQSDLPLASGSKHVACFERLGWTLDLKRRGRGSHFLLTKEGMRVTLSVPNHHEVKRALLAKLLSAAGISEETYIEHFKK